MHRHHDRQYPSITAIVVHLPRATGPKSRYRRYVDSQTEAIQRADKECNQLNIIVPLSRVECKRVLMYGTPLLSMSSELKVN